MPTNPALYGSALFVAWSVIAVAIVAGNLQFPRRGRTRFLARALKLNPNFLT